MLSLGVTGIRWQIDRSMPNDDPPLTLEQVKQLVELATKTYQKQSTVCLNAKAPLASCILAGAAVEAILIAVTRVLYDEAIQTGKEPKYTKGKRKGKTKDLLEWQFFELLEVASKAKWIPIELKLDEKVDLRTNNIPVRTDTIREARNLVHPARYMKDRKGKEYTHEELSTLRATCHAVYDCLEKKLYERHPNLAHK